MSRHLKRKPDPENTGSSHLVFGPAGHLVNDCGEGEVLYRKLWVCGGTIGDPAYATDSAVLASDTSGVSTIVTPNGVEVGDKTNGARQTCWQLGEPTPEVPGRVIGTFEPIASCDEPECHCSHCCDTYIIGYVYEYVGGGFSSDSHFLKRTGCDWQSPDASGTLVESMNIFWDDVNERWVLQIVDVLGAFQTQVFYSYGSPDSSGCPKTIYDWEPDEDNDPNGRIHEILVTDCPFIPEAPLELWTDDMMFFEG